jgi:hypothetical protein
MWPAENLRSSGNEASVKVWVEDVNLCNPSFYTRTDVLVWADRA